MTRSRRRNAKLEVADRVTPVEIFFDLVFVFTLTQLTLVLEADLTLAGLGRVLVLFGLLWWMFNGYVWLANHVPPRAPSHKLLLFVGMAGFLIAAVGIPNAFQTTGVLFGVGYLVVICVHLLLFTQANLGRALGWVAAYNLASAALVLTGGFAEGSARAAIWLVALLGQGVLPFLVPRLSWVHMLSSYHLEPGHFVERLGLLVIIALGESVVAIGIGVDVDHLGAGTVSMLVLALALPAALWWTYFTDGPAAEHALAAPIENERRIRLAIWIGFAHVPLLLGIVVASAGIHNAVAHPGDPATWPSALALAGGVAAFLVGIAVDRSIIGVRPMWSRLAAIAAVLATVPVGVLIDAGAQLAAVVLVLVAMLVPERGRHAEHSGHQVRYARW